MEIYQLKSFVAVAETNSLARASERIFTSVPAVSAQIKSLEEELGVRLFDRHPRGMGLTAAGQRLLVEARRTIEAAQRIRATASEIRGEVAGTVRMGTISDPLALRLGPVYVDLAEHHPKVVLQLEQGLSLRALGAVQRAQLDCAYVLTSCEQLDGLEIRRLAPMRIVIAVPSALVAERRPKTLEDLGGLPWITTPPDCGLRAVMDTLFRDIGRPFPTGPVADNEGSVRGLVAAGLGAALMRLDQAAAVESTGQAVIWAGWNADTWLCWAGPLRLGQVTAVAAVRESVLRSWDGGRLGGLLSTDPKVT